MKSLKTILPLLLLTTILSTNPIKSQTNNYTNILTTDKNIFEGMNFGNKQMIQFYAETNINNLTLGTWGNIDLKAKNLDEIDAIAKYKVALSDKLSIALGVTNYAIDNIEKPNKYGHAQEVFCEYSIAGGPVQISGKVGQATGAGSNNGRIAKINVSRTVPISSISNNLTATAIIGVRALDDYFCSGTGISDIHASASTSLDLGKGFSIDANYTYQDAVSKNFKGLVNSEGYTSIGISFFRE